MLPVPSQPQWGSPEHNWDHPPSPPRPGSRPAPPGFAPPRARSRCAAHLHHGLPVSPAPTPGSRRASGISSSVALFFCLQSFPVSWSFPVSQHFTSGSQSTGAYTSASVLPMNIQSWFPLGLTGLISLMSKGLSRVFSSTTVWKHQFFGAQPSLWSNSHVHTWLPA